MEPVAATRHSYGTPTPTTVLPLFRHAHSYSTAPPLPLLHAKQYLGESLGNRECWLAACSCHIKHLKAVRVQQVASGQWQRHEQQQQQKGGVEAGEGCKGQKEARLANHSGSRPGRLAHHWAGGLSLRMRLGCRDGGWEGAGHTAAQPSVKHTNLILFVFLYHSVLASKVSLTPLRKDLQWALARGKHRVSRQTRTCTGPAPPSRCVSVWANFSKRPCMRRPSTIHLE